jgi:predicted DNA-binding protein
MPRKKISTTIYITEEQDQRLKELSRKTKVSMSVFIREGIDLVLDKYKEQLSGQLIFDMTR